MSAPKLSKQLAGLSDDAKAVGGAWFGTMRVADGESHVQFGLQSGRPSARSAAALMQLVAAGVISIGPGDRQGSVRFCPLVDCSSLFRFAGKGADIVLVESITP